MKRLLVAMFGVFIVMFCIMPVLAREDSGTAPMAGGGQSVDIDTQTPPVLDGVLSRSMILSFSMERWQRPIGFQLVLVLKGIIQTATPFNLIHQVAQPT